MEVLFAITANNKFLSTLGKQMEYVAWNVLKIIKRYKSNLKTYILDLNPFICISY
jgi:hypothetical protein